LVAALTALDPVSRYTGLDYFAVSRAMALFTSPHCVIAVILGDGNSYETMRAYLGDLNAFGSWLRDRGRRWRSVTPEDLYLYRYWLARRYARSTVNRRLVAIRSLYAEANRRGITPSHPAERLRGLSRRTTER
jgi:site-specific recombinase XerD